MDSIDDGASIVAEEDRLSNLPDDIIHHILSFIDMRYAIQTSTLSQKWKNIWTSMSRLNINTYTSCPTYDYSEYVIKALSHRNDRAEVSGLELTFNGAYALFYVKNIVHYAYSKNVRQMSMKWYCNTPKNLPEVLFISHTLKHLTLDQDIRSTVKSRIPKSDWDFPALETLNLRNIRVGDVNDKSLNLFSKCGNLKDLTFHNCSMHGLEVFNVCAPQLSNLTITEPSVFPMIFNVVAPQLETLTTSVISNISAPSFFKYLRLSIKGSSSLVKVNLSLSNDKYKKEKLVPHLLELFRVLRYAKFLILDLDIIESLSSCLGQLSQEPCPFDNLNCLKINTAKLKQEDLPTIPTQVKNYLLENSPNSTFIMELPQVIAMLKEKTQMQYQVTGKLNAKINIQNQIIGKLKATLGAGNLHHEKLILQIIKCKVAKLKVQIERGNLDYQVICSIRYDIKDLMRGNLSLDVDALFSFHYEGLKSLLFNRINASQWVKIETGLGILRYSGRFNFNNGCTQSAVRAPVSRQSSANVAQEKSRQQHGTKQPEFMAREKQKEKTKKQMQDQVIANLKAKLEKQDQVIESLNVKIQKKDQAIEKLNSMLGRQNLQHEKLTLQIIKSKMDELKVQVETWNPDCKVIRSIGCDIKDLIHGNLKVNVQAQFSSEYKKLKSLLCTRIDARQWAWIESELWTLRHSERFPSNSSHSRSAVPAAELHPAPRLFSDNVPQKRSRQPAPTDTMANKVAKTEAGKMQPETMLQEKRMLEAKIQMQDQLIARMNADIQVQFQVTGQQQAKIQMQDQLIARMNADLQVQFQVTGQQKGRIQMQDEVIGNMRAKLGARNLQHEKMISHFITCKMAELKRQAESGNLNYEVIHLIRGDIEDLICGSLSENVEAQFSSKFEELKGQLLTCIDASQWAMIKTFLGNLSHSQRFPFDSSHSQSVVRGAKLPPVRRPFLDNMATSTGSDSESSLASSSEF